MLILLFLMALAGLVHASPINATAIARRDPALRGGFIDHCSIYGIISLGEEYGHLHASCSLTPWIKGSEFYSSLDLSLCMGNYNNHLAWGYLGGAMASCQNCVSRHFATRYVDCDCGTIDLNEGIYVADNGAVACYDKVSVPHSIPT